MAFLIATAMTLDAQETFKPDHAANLTQAQKLPPPDHTKADIDGMQGVMFASAIENESGGSDPVRLPGCQVYLAPATALHEHLSFPCNDWFLPPADGSYLVWLATEDAVSSQVTLMNRNVPYKGFGTVSIHDMQPAGFVTVGGPVPPDHTVRYMHLDAPGTGFLLRVTSRDAGKKFPMPPGRVVAGIFNSRDEAVAYQRPLTVKAGETSTFRIVPPDRGSDLVAILSRPEGHRNGPPLEVVLKGAVSRAPDVLSDRQRRYVVAVWYGLTDERVTVTATAPTLELNREVELRPRAVSTLRADVAVKEGTEE